jgi:hypothetical protein
MKLSWKSGGETIPGETMRELTTLVSGMRGAGLIVVDKNPRPGGGITIRTVLAAVQVEFVTAIQQDPVTHALQVKKRKCLVFPIETESDWVDVVSPTACEE